MSWEELIVQAFDLESELLRVRYYPSAAIQKDVGEGNVLYDTTFHYVHYHVAQEVIASNRVRMLHWNDYIQPNFALETAFDLNLFTS